MSTRIEVGNGVQQGAGRRVPNAKRQVVAGTDEQVPRVRHEQPLRRLGVPAQAMFHANHSCLVKLDPQEPAGAAPSSEAKTLFRSTAPVLRNTWLPSRPIRIVVTALGEGA